MNDHKFLAKTEKTHVYQHFNKIGWNRVKIILIEKFNLNDRYELLREQDKYIRANINNLFCLNMKTITTMIDKTEKSIENEDYTNYNKYNDSKIYRIYSNDGFYYYGSTYDNVMQRFLKHIDMSKRPENKNLKLYSYFKKIGWENAKIEIIKNLNINTKNELLEEENKYIQQHINDPFCLNMRISYTGLTKAEYNKKYNIQNFEKLNTRRKEYLNENRDYFKEYERIRNQNPERKLKREKHNSEKIICMCGHELRRDSIRKHIRTQKHQNYIKNQQE